MARLGEVRVRRAQRAVPVPGGDLARRGHQGKGVIDSVSDARANEKGQEGVVAPSAYEPERRFFSVPPNLCS